MRADFFMEVEMKRQQMTDRVSTAGSVFGAITALLFAAAIFAGIGLPGGVDLIKSDAPPLAEPIPTAPDNTKS
jgi:hypothetical protein